MECGTTHKISEATDDDLRRAGQTGFEALRGGEEGLYEALGTLVSPVSLRTVRHQSDFGAFFEWLRTSSMGEDFDALRDRVRDFIFRTYPFRDGDTVLGKTCSKPTVFTISGAWQSLGIQRSRMNRILLAEGLAHKSRADNSVRLFEGLKMFPSKISGAVSQPASMLLVRNQYWALAWMLLTSCATRGS